MFALQLLPNRRSIEYDVVMSYESYLNSNFQMALLKLTFKFKINLETCTSLCMCCIFSFPDMYLLDLEIIFPSHVQILHVQTPLGKILMSSVIKLYQQYNFISGQPVIFITTRWKYHFAFATIYKPLNPNHVHSRPIFSINITFFTSITGLAKFPI